MRNIVPAVGLLVLLWTTRAAAECVTVGSDPNKPPPKPQTFVVSGAFCGKVSDPIGPLTVPGVELELRDATTLQSVAKANVDGNATFTFARLRPGTYRALIPGFAATAEMIEIRSSNDQQRCEQRLYIMLVVGAECAESRISDKPFQQ